VMDRGRIVAEGSPAELIRRHATREVLELRFPVGVQDGLDLGRLSGIGQRVEALPDRLLVYADDGDAAAVEVHDRGFEPASVLARRSTLEDVFLTLTGRTLVD
jgi:lipooligosaccharide transport system ATP-binding protein